MTPRLLLALACTGLAAPAAAEPLAGLYHLTGRTGGSVVGRSGSSASSATGGNAGSSTLSSELLLDDDGRYAWMLVAEGRDATSAGTWRREGEKVVLVADRAPQVAAPFELATDPPLQAWDAAAEQALAGLARQARRGPAKEDPQGRAGGHGVRVVGPDGEPVGQVRVEFTFGDGRAAPPTTVRATTDRASGLAVVPLRPGAPLRALSLTASLEGGRELSQALALPAGAEQGGVVRVQLDATSLIRSPFERMVLTVVEGGLRSSDPAGLYRRD